MWKQQCYESYPPNWQSCESKQRVITWDMFPSLKESYWMTFHGLLRPFKCTLNLKLKAKRIKIEEIMAKQSQRELKVSSPLNKCVPHLKQVFKPILVSTWVIGAWLGCDNWVANNKWLSHWSNRNCCNYDDWINVKLKNLPLIYGSLSQLWHGLTEFKKAELQPLG